MKEDSIIKELYDHFDELNFGFRPNDARYMRYEKEREKAYEKLMDALPENVKKLFEEYEDADSNVLYMQEKEIYRQGVCFGVKIISEAFVTNKNRAVAPGDEY